MRVLVCGGRDYWRPEVVNLCLDHVHSEYIIDVIIHGDCSGADRLAGAWAVINGIEIDAFPIRPGEGGFARNSRMLIVSSPGLVVFFPGGFGTRDMVRRARGAGVEVLGGLEVVGEIRQMRLV